MKLTMVFDDGLDVVVDALLESREAREQAVQRVAVEHVQLRERRGLGTTGQRLEEDAGLDEQALRDLDDAPLLKASPTLSHTL